MKLLIVYATTHGQTRKIMEFLQAELAKEGWSVTMNDVAEAPPGPSGFDAVIIAASLHRERYQQAIIDYVRSHREAIERLPNAFVSVSLACAGQRTDDTVGLERCLERFSEESGWSPRHVHHAAGAFRFSRYGLITRLIMKSIARRRGQPTARDKELTDWRALETTAHRLARELEAAAAAAG